MHGNIDTVNFQDHSMYYTSAKNIEDVMESVEQDLVSLLQWFELKLLKGNAYKFHFLTCDDQEVSANVDNFAIKKSKCEKLLEIKFNSKFTFAQHISY